MISGWLAKIKAAQHNKHITIEGKSYTRVKYGDEEEDWGAEEHLCHDCGVKKNQFHVRGCDVERCPKCKLQLITCGCEGKGT